MKRLKRIRKRTVLLILLAAAVLVGVWLVETGRWQRMVERIERSKTVILEGVPEFCQFPDYPRGSECVSLWMLLKYYGVEVTVDGIIAELPQGSLPYELDGEYYGADPECEFVGSPNEESAYGVFNQPIAYVAEKFRPGVVTTVGASVEDIIEIIDGGNPVMVWYIGDTVCEAELCRSWLSEDTGTEVWWTAGEQAGVVYGHDSAGNFYISDPLTGSSITADADRFKEAFSMLGGRIVFYGNKPSAY